MSDTQQQNPIVKSLSLRDIGEVAYLLCTGLVVREGEDICRDNKVHFILTYKCGEEELASARRTYCNNKAMVNPRAYFQYVQDLRNSVRERISKSHK